MSHYRNSQKRIHIPGASYFITGVTKNRFCYFEEEIFCEIFAENLKFCQQLKDFELHAWFLGYDHFHLLMTPRGEWNISKIIQNLKRTSSLKINQIASPNKNKIPCPIFRWQQSFHDHVIRDEEDFLNHMNYIAGNPLKHNMPDG